jgi:hypothetical protein
MDRRAIDEVHALLDPSDIEAWTAKAVTSAPPVRGENPVSASKQSDRDHTQGSGSAAERAALHDAALDDESATERPTAEHRQSSAPRGDQG